MVFVQQELAARDKSKQRRAEAIDERKQELDEQAAQSIQQRRPVDPPSEVPSRASFPELKAELQRVTAAQGSAANMAFAAAVVLKKEEQWEAYREVYERTGRIPEFELHKKRLMTEDNPANTDRIFKRARALAEREGFDPNIVYDPSNAHLFQSIKTEMAFKAGLGRDEATAVLTAYADALMRNEPIPQLPPAEMARRAEIILTPGVLVQEELDYNKKLLDDIMALDAKYGASRDAAGKLKTTAGIPSNLKYGSWAETILGFTYELFPVVDAVHRKQLITALQDVYGNSGPDNAVLPGNISKVLREWIARMPLSQRKGLAERWAKAVHGTTAGGTDMKAWISNMITFTPGLMERFDTDGSYIDWIDNIAITIDAFIGGSILRRYMQNSAKHALGPMLRILNTANKSRATTVFSEMTARYNAGRFKDTWGIHKEDFLMSQWVRPGVKPGTKLYDTPSWLTSEEFARVTAARGEVDDVVGRARNVLFTDTEKLTSITKQITAIEAAHSPAIRPNLSEVIMHEDGGGINFKIMLAADDKYGFATLQDALERAVDIELDGVGIQFYRVELNNDLTPLVTGQEALEMSPKQLVGTKGPFYIQHEQQHFFSPTDKLLFAEDAVASPSWLGRTKNYLLTPSANLDAETYKPFAINFLRSQALAGLLDDIVRPLGKLGFKDRRALNKIYEHQEWFGRENGRMATSEELMEKFPEINATQLQGHWTMKEFYDAIYHIQNDRVYRDWSASGLKTIRKGKAHYEGLPLSEGSVLSMKKAVSFYDPETQKAVHFTKQQKHELYLNGGTIIKTEIPITGPKHRQYTLVVQDEVDGWELVALTRRPVQYVEGYWPRIHKDPVHIQRVIEKGYLNGIQQETTETIAFARSIPAANKFMKKLDASHKAKGLPPWKWAALVDSRLTSKDRIASDLERMQVQGRLFFDERSQKRVYDTEGNIAEIFDPMEMLQRTSRIIGRQVGMEDLTRNSKQMWQNTFGDLLGARANVENTSGLRIRNALIEKLQKAHAPESARLLDALTIWDHIRLMEGSIDDSKKMFKRLAIHAADWVDHVTTKATGGVVRATQYLARNAGAQSLGDRMKSLAFLDFIVVRAPRQLVLQSGQHLFLSALDPTYTLRWQMDAFAIMSGMKARNLTLAGVPKMHKDLLRRNAQIMRMTEQEYLLVLKEFNDFGGVQGINLHSFVGEVRGPRHVAGSRLGDTALQVGRGLLKPRDLLQKYGFDLGETINVTHAWAMALRLARKGDKLLSKPRAINSFSREEWNEIGIRGQAYALAMNRSNQAAFQRGAISVPLQFMQFTHKVLLTFLRAVPGPVGKKLGNKSFTQAEAMRIVIGQFILFGSAGFGVKDYVHRRMSDANMEQYIGTEVVDLIEGGLIDWMVDKSLQALFNDPDLDLTVDEFLAPGANSFNLAKRVWEIGMEFGDIAKAIGPVGVTGSRIWQMLKIGADALRVPSPRASSTERLAEYLEIMSAGVFSQFNDFVRAKAAARAGVWLGKHGERTDLEATWAGIIAKGVLGLNEQKVLDSYHFKKDLGAVKSELTRAGELAWKNYATLNALFRKGEIGETEYDKQVRWLRIAIYETFDEGDRIHIDKAFVDAARRSLKDPTGPADQAAALAAEGFDISALKDRIANSTAIAEKDKEPLMEMIDRAVRGIEEVDPEMLERIQRLADESEREVRARREAAQDGR